MTNLLEEIKKRILVLDGAIGTMIQRYKFKESDFRGLHFMNHETSLQGFNDILNISKPSAIKEIHKKYIKAGADIISTNTFNSNSISMKDYGLDNIKGLVEKINKEGAKLAREAIFESKAEINKPIFIAGSIGPTNRSASMSPDITNPLKRNISYDDLFQAYYEQVSGLLDGGVDLLLFETFFDTLNLKSGLDAANKAMASANKQIPIMVSATVSDNAGRILSGQTIEAFAISVSHYDNVISIGLNCGFGPDRLIKYIEELNHYNPHYTSLHPNAGLPDALGCYNLTPEEFCNDIKPLIKSGKVNIVGGCCGTTPDFIRELSKMIKNGSPRKLIDKKESLLLSGLNALNVENRFLKIGERCNVAGSAKFLRLIKEGSLEEAAAIAANQIEKGADVIDINMDDALLNAKEEMVKFIRYILAEPEVAKVPFMIDSSRWEVIEDALKEIQGKGIVNSLSLKEGEETFIKRAKKVKDLGFSLVVMAFDELGQADTYERKISICKRAYKLLTEKCGFSGSDIIFDVNVMTIATGMPEHSLYALDFIRAVEWIKGNLPGARTSGGVSNLSFAFRGKNKIREYMHIIFLHHAKKAGLDMAIINPSQTTLYEEIPQNIRTTIEDIIFNRDTEAVEKLIEYAGVETKTVSEGKSAEKLNLQNSIEETLRQDLIRGELLALESHIISALEKINDPVAIIEGPLLDGMKTVGDLFGEGKMFLPQVVKTARSMKKAVEILTPFIEKNRKSEKKEKSGKILIATVKGDVHDIGKNIVATVLSCNNYEVIDLGIMVPAEKIVDTALKEHPDIICLSGLITPSLSEMVETVRKLSDAGINVPVMVGGAATSALHTALKISPDYEGMVIHMPDASQNPIVANKILNPETKNKYEKELKDSQEKLRSSQKNSVSLAEYEKIKSDYSNSGKHYICEKPKTELNHPLFFDIPLTEIQHLINWKMFFLAWKIKGSFISDMPLELSHEDLIKWVGTLKDSDRQKAIEAVGLYETAKEILQSLEQNNKYNGKGVVIFEKIKSEGEDLIIGNKKFPMLRQQRSDSRHLSVVDFISKEKCFIGLFAVTAGQYIFDLSKNLEKDGDSYTSLVVQALSDRLVEASAEWLQNQITKKYWRIDIRPAWGYPMMPDQTLILDTQDLLTYKEIGISLTENGAMYPPASISGLFIQNPAAQYFMVGEIGEDQMLDYASRRDKPIETIKEKLGKSVYPYSK